MSSDAPFEPDVWRVSGGGNDFLALAEPARDPTAAEVRAWCRRGLSLGADGVFVLRRPGADGDAPAGGAPRVAMAYFNADGGAASLCLNGTRCAAQLAFHLGWASGEVTLLTGAGPVDASAGGPEHPRTTALELPVPTALPRPWEGTWQGQPLRGHVVTVGVPHLVIPWNESLAGAPVAALGAALVHRELAGPGGVNVDLVRWPAPDRLEIRTYERGVFAETLACGTGVLASVAAGVAQARAEGRPVTLPVAALTAGGFTLTVGGDAADIARGSGRWTLAGDARVLTRGRLLAAAAALPPEPPWSP